MAVDAINCKSARLTFLQCAHTQRSEQPTLHPLEKSLFFLQARRSIVCVVPPSLAPLCNLCVGRAAISSVIAKCLINQSSVNNFARVFVPAWQSCCCCTIGNEWWIQCPEIENCFHRVVVVVDDGRLHRNNAILYVAVAHKSRWTAIYIH